jgi:hypothetical protein
VYQDAYYEADALVKSIRDGTYARPTTTTTGVVENKASRGLVPRKPVEQPESYDPLKDDLMMAYFVAIRDQSETLKKTLQSPESPAGGGTLGTPVVGDVGRAREALASVESGGNYQAIGPVVQRGSYAGDRAYGKYQVMGKNIPSWTEEVLGRAYTPEEFLSDPAAQDAVVEAKLQKSKEKYGTWEDAASVWFTGGPLAKNAEKSDGYIDAAEYVSRFQSAYART